VVSQQRHITVRSIDENIAKNMHTAMHHSTTQQLDHDVCLPSHDDFPLHWFQVAAIYFQFSKSSPGIKDPPNGFMIYTLHT
jgi:hypothetical protein